MSDFAAYRDFVVNSLKLMVWYVKHLVSREDIGFRCLKHSTCESIFCSHTALYDGRHPASVLDPPNAEWENLKSQLGERIVRIVPILDELEAEPAGGCSSRWLHQSLEPGTNDPRVIRTVHSSAGDSISFQSITFCRTLRSVSISILPMPASPSRHSRPPSGAVGHQSSGMLIEATRTSIRAKTAVCGSWLNRFAPFLRFVSGCVGGFVPGLGILQRHRRTLGAVHGPQGRISRGECRGPASKRQTPV